MRVAVLGVVTVVGGDGEVVRLSRRQRALVAALAVDRRRIWGVDELAEAVWGSETPPTAGRLVRNRISELRRCCGRALVDTVGTGYRLGPGVVLDLEELDDQQPGPSLQLWRGSALDDVTDWPPAQPMIQGLLERRKQLAESQVRALVNEGEVVRAATLAEGLVIEEPYREQSWALLARARYAAGRQRDALIACQQARSMLRDEFGLEPGLELADIEQAVLRHDSSLRPVSRSGRPPWPTSRLIGRSDDLERVRRAIAENRLVTITGLGGIGKTRLALEVVARTDAGALHYVDLSTAESDGDTALTVVRALDLPLARDAESAIELWSTGATGLLLVDNAEHVPSSARRAIDRLVTAGPNLRVLVTSRMPLGLPYEVVVRLGPLDLGAAVALYDARSVHRHDRAAVALYCSSVDRLPLAIEIGAAKADVIPPDELARSFGPDATVADVIDWSVGALTDRARTLLARMALLPAPLSIAAMAGIHSGVDPAEAMAELAGQSLVEVQRGSRTQYRLLHLVRQPVSRLLPQDHHERAFDRVTVVDWAARVVDGMDLDNADQHLADVENLGAAHALAIDGHDTDRAVRIAAALRYLPMFGRTEALGWVEQTLMLGGVSAHRGFADLAGLAAWNLALGGRTDDALRWADDAIEAEPTGAGAGWGWKARAILSGDPTADDRALAIAVEIGDPFLELSARSTIVGHLGSAEAAMAHADGADTRARQVGAPWAEEIAAFTRAVALHHIDPAGSARQHRRAMNLADIHGHHFVSAATRLALLVDGHEGGPDVLRDDCDTLRRILLCGMDAFVPLVLRRVAQHLRAEGNSDAAAAVDDLAWIRSKGSTITERWLTDSSGDDSRRPRPALQPPNESAVLQLLEAYAPTQGRAP